MNTAAERNQVMELVKTLPNDQLNYIFRIIQSLPDKKSVPEKCTLRGRFSKYANPELREKEKGAWSLAAEEKHALR